MDRIRALIERLLDESTRAEELASLDDAAVSDLVVELRAAFAQIRAGEMDGVNPLDTATLTSIAEAVRTLNAEKAARVEAAATAEAEVAALEAEMTPTEPTPDGDPAPEPSPDPEPAPEPAPIEATAPPAPRPAVNRPSLAALAAARPAAAQPVIRPGESVASPRWQSFDGHNIEKAEIAERINAAQSSLLEAPPGYADKVVVARVKVAFPEERMMSGGDDAMVFNTKKLEALTAGAQDPRTYDNPEIQAIVAAGGFCAPPTPIYDLANVSSAARPVRDGLPRVGAPRGAVTFVRSPGLAGITTTGAGAGVSIWTNANDIAPANPATKPLQTFACRDAVTRTLQAIIYRARFGNFMGRAFPELVADDVELLMAAHARLAETELLDSIVEQINVDVTQTGAFGTLRSLLHYLRQAAAQLRYVERMATGSRFRALMAREALDMAQADVVFQTASGELDALRIDENQVRAMLANTGVNISYAMDVPAGPDAFVPNADTQALADFPDTLEIPIFPEGTVVFLDGGQLDIGIVRDSALNNTNDYELFAETFEEAAWLGPRALTLTLTSCPNGDSQLPVRVTDICSGS